MENTTNQVGRPNHCPLQKNCTVDDANVKFEVSHQSEDSKMEDKSEDTTEATEEETRY